MMTVIVKDGMVQVWMLEGGLRSMNKVMEVDLGSEEVLRGTIAFATQGNSGLYLSEISTMSIETWETRSTDSSHGWDECLGGASQRKIFLCNSPLYLTS